jgi:DNA-binding NarL/FixJ family response regulator
VQSLRRARAAQRSRLLRVCPDAAPPGGWHDCRVCRSVLIVDDHDGFRGHARALLEAAGFRVVGEAADGESALVEAARLRPSLVLLDIQLPDFDGFEVAARLARGADPPAIVLTSTRTVGAYRTRLACAQALGFISKGELSAATLAALGV